MGRFAALIAVAALAAGCSAGDPAPPAAAPAATPTATSAATSAAAPTAGSAPAGRTVWLCRPGLAGDPCAGDLTATVVAADGTRRTEPAAPAAAPPVDCFYVYPTVSRAPTRNAPRRATDAERDTARAQVARFSTVCRVYAPVYRQVTLRGLATGGLTDPAARALAHGDVVTAWHEYLAANPGRRFVLIGHSQGAFELTQLVQEEIDGDPALRSRLVSALLLGGFVSVDPATGTGDLRSVPACRRATQTGCVVAYNSYAGAPPAGSVFGRTGNGRRILCVNPAALGGGPAAVTPYVPSGTGFLSPRGVLRAECRTGGGASWLDVTATTPAARALLATDRPTWGLHRADVNLTLGDLVTLVRTQSGPG